MPLLETRSIGKCFKEGTQAEVRALSDVSLAIDPGQFVLLSGPSGSGKTTLLAILGALTRPSRGQVFFENRDFQGFSDMELARVRRRMGFIFQNFSLIPGLPVWENITYPLIPLGVSPARRCERAAELLAGMGLGEKLKAYPEELSGGEQQRVAVARALVAQPAILLADEPTSNLDQEAGSAILELLQSIHRQGTTIIVSSHDPRTVSLATNVFRLDRGRLMAAPAS